MGRKAANHKHYKGEDGKRHCNNPCVHRRKGTARRGCLKSMRKMLQQREMQRLGREELSRNKKESMDATLKLLRLSGKMK